MLSFVIPAHNEEVLLPRTLRAVHEAARSAGFERSAALSAGRDAAHDDARREEVAPGSGSYEILVADDASTDRTAEIAREHGARVVSIDRRQIAAARNAGARAATGDILIFVDADTEITAAALRAALETIRRGAHAGGTSIRFDGHVPRYAHVVLPIVLTLFRAMRMAGGCFIFCTRETCEAVGGWDESVFASEELLFAKAVKRRYGRRSFVVLHEEVITSGRKLRTYTPRELFGPLLGVAIRGRRGLATRDRLGVWYDPRRPDPEACSPSGEAVTPKA